MKRWALILLLLLLMLPMPAVAQDGTDIEVYPDDQELNFHGYAGEEEVYLAYLQLKATGGAIDRFRITKHELDGVDGGPGRADLAD
jgi:hypothetical protein